MADPQEGLLQVGYGKLEPGTPSPREGGDEEILPEAYQCPASPSGLHEAAALEDDR